MPSISKYSDYKVLFCSSGSGSSSGDLGSTGVALALSTAGSSGVLSGQSSSPGGFPIASTQVNSAVSMIGWEGCQFIATVAALSTASPSLHTLQAYFAQGSTYSSTTWVAIQGAFANAYSTGAGSSGFGAIVVDVFRPKFPAGYSALSAVLQQPTSSGNIATLVAQRYGGRTFPTGTKGPGFGTSQDITSTGLGNASTANSNVVTSVNGTT